MNSNDTQKCIICDVQLQLQMSLLGYSYYKSITQSIMGF